MRRQLAMGAGIALAVGAVAVGCSSSKSSGGFFAPPTSVDLNNGDNAPMTAISANNLAADNAGFSGSNQNFIELACVVNKKPSNTDGPASSADGSAIVAFQTSDQLDGHFRLYMSYFDGGSFTPPIEVTGVDRDEYRNAGGAPDIHTNSILMIPLNTSGYKGATNSTTGDAGAVRANSGNWVIVWDATTYTVAPNTTGPNPPFGPGAGGAGAGNNAPNNFNPNNTTSQQWFGTSTAQVPNIVNQRIQQNLQGVHRALYETVFVKSLKSQPSAFSTVLGTNAASTATTTAPSREYRYGFLVTAPQVTTLKRGAEAGFTSVNILNNIFNATNPVNPDVFSPAEDVVSYGMASDGLSGCSTFSGSGTPFSQSTLNPTPLGGSPFQFVMQPHTFLGLQAHGGSPLPGAGQGALIANAGGGAPGAANYVVGEDVTFVHLFWTQIVSSANSGDTAVAMTPELEGNDVSVMTPPGGGPPTAVATGTNAVHVGNRLAMFQTGLDLRTLQFDSENAATPPGEVTVPSALLTEPASQPLKAAQSPIASFNTYNQFVFANFVDASIAHTDSTGLSGNTQDNRRQFISQNASVREFNLALLVYTVTDALNGTSTVGATPTRLNVTPLTSLKADNLDVDGFGSASTAATETFGNQDQAWLPGCCMFGEDEGLGDLTVFFVEQHSSAAATTDANLDLELCAAVLKGDGTLQSPGTNPVRLSVHGAENTDTFNVHSNVQNVVGHPDQILLITGTTNTTGPSGTSEPASGSVFEDPVEGVSCCMNRTGQYVVVTYRQFQGTSSTAFSKALNAVVMKTFRFASSTQSASGGVPITGSTGTAPQVDTRFAAATRIDTTTTSSAISGQPGTPAPQVPFQVTFGATTVSTGFVNMFYSINNPLLGLNPVAVFPTSTGVNGQAVAPCGYRCGYQSDNKLVNVLWEQSDSSDDRLFVRQLSIDITGATPVVTLGSVGEFESGTQVKGDATANLDAFGGVTLPNGGSNSGVRDFIQGDVSFPFATDLGVDSAKKGGGLLVVYAKTTDATTSDGNFYNREIVAVQWDGSTLSNRTIISRGIQENSTALSAAPNIFPAGGATLSIPVFTAAGVQFGNYVTAGFGTGAAGLPPTTVPSVQPFSFGIGTPGSVGAGNHALKTNMVNMVSVPTNPDINGSPTLSPQNTYIYFTTPNGDNTDSGVGLYTRTFNHTIRTNANNALVFGDQFVPKASTAPSATGFAQPERMDHMTGGDVTGTVSVNISGKTVTVLFWQDGHLWLSGTNDGATQDYTEDAKGSADPFLVDNDTSASAQFASVTGYTDSACNNLHKSILFFGKNDLSQTNSGASATSPNKANGGVGGNSSYAFRLRLRVFN